MKLTGSRLPLAETCIGAAVFPQVSTPSTDAQTAGTGRHRYLERAARVGRDAALAEIPADAPWRATCEGIDVEQLPRGEYEVAYAYDVATDRARQLGQWIARAYGDTSSTEVTGTADLVVPAGEGRPRPLVVDFKGRERVEPAGSNLQLGFYAMCASLVLDAGLEEIDVAICYVDEDGSLEWDRASLGPFELADIARRVSGLVAARDAAARELAAGRVPDLSQGLHCARCHALTSCPAMVGLVRAALVDPPAPAEVGVGLAVLDDAAAGRAWVKLGMLEALLDAMKASLRARAELRGLPLPDGSTLIPQERTRRTVDVERALDALRPMFGAQADSLVERSLSVEALRGLARQIAPGKGQRKAADELLASLEAVGAVKTSRFVVLTVRKPRAIEAQS